MKARIDNTGILHIEPETELEEYALTKWSYDNPVHHTSGGSTMSGNKILIYCRKQTDYCECGN